MKLSDKINKEIDEWSAAYCKGEHEGMLRPEEIINKYCSDIEYESSMEEALK